MNRRTIWVIVSVVLVGVATFFLPVSYVRVLTEGTDSYATHIPLFGDKVRSQTLEIQRPIVGVGVLAVNLRKAAQLAPLHVEVRSGSGEVVATMDQDTGSLVDDMFLWVSLPHTISPEQSPLILRFSAPQGTKDNPLGLRFEAEGEKRLALAVQERMLLWERLQIWIQDHVEASERLLYGGGTAAAVLILGWWLSESGFLAKPYGWVIALVLLGMFTLWLRLPILQRIEGVFGGDAYNNIFKANAWALGHDPFASDFRKGPFYPFLLLPGLVTPDPLLWGRWITLLSSAGAVVLVAVLARALGAPPVLALLSGFLLAVMREFRFESVHALSNITFGMLIVGMCVTFVYAQRYRMAYGMSVLGGLVALTRYEGILVPALFVPMVWIYHRLRWKFVVYTLVPLMILLAIPFLLWPITGQIGVRTPADIKGDGGLSLALSWYEWQQNLRELKNHLGLEWFFIPALGRQLFVLGLGVLAGVGIMLVAKVKSGVIRNVIASLPYIGLMWLVWLVVRDFHDTLKLSGLFLTFLVGWGAGSLMVMRPKHGMPIVMMVVMQAVVVTMILPKIRYYIHLIPFLALGVTWAVVSVTRWDRWWSRAGGLLLVGFSIGIVWQHADMTLPGMVSDYNGKAIEAAVMTRAAKFVRQQEGEAGMATDDLSFRIYVGDPRLRWFPHTETSPSLTRQIEWIRDQEIEWIVETTFHPRFSIAAENPDSFTLAAEFESEGKEARVWVYKVDNNLRF